MVWEFGLQGVVNKWVSVNKKGVHVNRSTSLNDLDKSGRDNEKTPSNEQDSDQSNRHGNYSKTKSKSKQKTRLRSSSKSSNSIEGSAEDGSSVKNVATQLDPSSLQNVSSNLSKQDNEEITNVQTTSSNVNNIRSSSRSNRLERSNSQTDMLMSATSMNIRPQRRRSLTSSMRHPQPPGYRGMDTSMHSISSNISVGSSGSVLSGSIRSTHSVGNGSLSLQQINSMPWVNEGYDRAMKKREGARFMTHNVSNSITNDVRSRDSSSISRSDIQVSNRKSRLLNHMKEHYPQEYKHYSQSLSPRQQSGSLSRKVVQSPVRVQHMNNGVARKTALPPPPTSSPSSISKPLNKVNAEIDTNIEESCSHCLKMSSKVGMIEEELLYLRSLVNKSESCDYCKDSKRISLENDIDYHEELHESTSLKKASQRLSDTTFRHKRQIEQMSRERVSTPFSQLGLFLKILTYQLFSF